MIDTHCHIDEEAFDTDREEVIERQKNSGVAAMVVPGVNGASITSVMEVCHRHPDFCYPALGLHPEDVKDDWRTQLDAVEQAIRTHRTELVAIGEIGLDYHWDTTYKTEQQEVLKHQLLLARELNLPVILHNREATEDILHIVKEISQAKLQRPNGNAVSELRGVFHCFNGSREVARQILDMGFYLGIGGVVTFKNCKLADHLDVVPLSRIVLETDAPYMAPVPHRGERNESRFIAHVVERLAAIYQLPKETIIEQTSHNARQLFLLK